jgi:hypothetical protein
MLTARIQTLESQNPKLTISTVGNTAFGRQVTATCGDGLIAVNCVVKQAGLLLATATIDGAVCTCNSGNNNNFAMVNI